MTRTIIVSAPRSLRFALLVVAVVPGLLVGNGLRADDPPAAKTPADEKKGADEKKADPPSKPAQPGKKKSAPPVNKPGSLQFQELDDVVEPLEPVKSRTTAEQAQLEGRAWYATGKILEEHDPQAALSAYKKAIERDPQAVAVYKALVPLAIALNLTEDGYHWASKAVELDPSDFELLRKLGKWHYAKSDIPGALRLLEQSEKAQGLKKNSPFYVELMLELGTLYRTQKRPEDAARCYEVLFDAMQNPDKYNIGFTLRSTLQKNASRTYEEIGQAFLEAKKSDLAIQAFRKAASSRKGATGSLSYNIAQVYFQDNQPEKALEELQKYFDEQRQTKGRAAYELLAEILKKLKKEPELLTRLSALAEKDPHNASLQYFLAEQYTEANRLEEAEKLFKQTLKSSANSQGYMGLAKVYRKLNRPGELLQALAKAYGDGEDGENRKIDRLQPEFKAILEDSKLLASLLDTAKQLRDAKPPKLDFATAYVAANLAAEAKDRLQLAVDLYRFALLERRDRAETILEELGQTYVSARKYAEGAKVFEEAANDPALKGVQAHFLFLLTQARELAGDTEGAIKAIKDAQEILQNHPLLRYQEAWVYYHSQQYDQAIKRFEAVIADFPQLQHRQIIRRAQFSLSNIHVQRGQVRKGEEILEQVLRETPDDPSVNNDLGYLYADQGKNLEQADKMIRKAIKSEPDNGAYLDSMGWVLFKQGKAAEALPYLEKAVKIGQSGSGDETLWDHLGDIQDKLQRSADALNSWKKALISAKKATRPDAKLISRLEEKIKAAEANPSKLKPQKPGSP